MNTLFVFLDPSDNEEFTEGAIHIVQQLIPELSEFEKDQFSFQFFTEGVTNKLVCITALPIDFRVCLRTYGNYTDYLIDRKQERVIMKSYGQQTYGGFLNGVAYAYTPGRTMDYTEFRKPEIMKKMVKCISNFHKMTPPLIKEPVLFKQMRAWLNNLPTTYVDKVKREKTKTISYEFLMKEVEYTEKKLTELNSPVVCCHNDLYLKNFIYNVKEDTIRMIDFEYSSYNYQAFDLANHFTEWCGLVMDWKKIPNSTYLEEFYGKKPTDDDVDKLYDVVNKFQLATNLLWAIWGFVDAALSNIDWDYMDYAWHRLNKYFELKKIFE
ncbi:ethanolamine kinase [Entamoeba marina]